MTSWPNCIRAAEPLANHTSFRIGGPAEWFAEPANLEELIAVLRQAGRSGLPVSVLSGGTNMLVADRGIRGLVVRLGKGFRTIDEMNASEEPSARVRCGAALLTQRLVSLASRNGWDQVESLAGLPGRLGGAVAMNAQEIGRFVQQVQVVSMDGAMRTLARGQLRFGYRDAALGPGILTDMVLEFPRIDPAEAYDRIRRAMQYRNSTQDTRLPSAGCAFKNPPGTGAGRLIDQAGLKGSRIGDAMISHRHANFIVNLGGATCDDVLALMEYAQHRVMRQFRVWLDPEVRMMGEAVS